MAKKATKVTFDKELFKKEVENNVKSLFRITFKEADSKQIFKAAAYAVQDLIVDNWMKTQDAYEKEDPKTYNIKEIFISKLSFKMMLICILPVIWRIPQYIKTKNNQCIIDCVPPPWVMGDSDFIKW